MKLGRRLLGRYLFEHLMKASFYGHFVAGEDVARIRPLVQRNMSFGVKSILDYSVEKDISREEARAAELAYVSLVARLFNYMMTLTTNYSLNAETVVGSPCDFFVTF